MIPDYWRQLDFFNPEKAKATALVVGAGSIGSHHAYILLSMGFKKVILVDDDVVEPHNLPNQFFSRVGIKTNIAKVDVFRLTAERMIGDISNLEVIKNKIENVIQILFDNNYIDVVCVTVDNMKTRKNIFEFLKNNKYCHTRYLVDGRVGGEFANIFAIDLGNDKSRQYYESQLWTDGEVPQLPCTGWAISDISFQVAGAMASQARKLIMGKPCVTHTFFDYKIMQAWVMSSVNNNSFKSTVSEQVKTGGENVNDVQ